MFHRRRIKGGFLAYDSNMTETRKLKMTIGSVKLEAELFDTPTADAICAKLPFTSTASTWGDEVYFSTAFRAHQHTSSRFTIASTWHRA